MRAQRSPAAPRTFRPSCPKRRRRRDLLGLLGPRGRRDLPVTSGLLAGRAPSDLLGRRAPSGLRADRVPLGLRADRVHRDRSGLRADRVHRDRSGLRVDRLGLRALPAPSDPPARRDLPGTDR
ncbi:hypothetical protein A5710_12285 [Mycolicibacter sinensis]|uniref:Uncharacterized protein n=1 Tax=Mycolicibacter sinensis (strain JDM601) TaxID=875328 RepID=A0A1A2Y7N5_MYCSD|nr:hypothetical protein A5694_07415 [Mycolicibacter sinensis]OBI34104.1 hypothetical protein A5710_12285 [Mycolicibacter sinensis]